MCVDWELAYIMPNLNCTQKFETEYVAVVPYEDERIQNIRKNNKDANILLDGFIDDMKRKIEPAVLIFNKRSPEKVKTVEAIVSFRNLIAMSVLLMGWSAVRPEGTPFNPLFSDSFDFYPITLGKDHGLITITPAITGYRTTDAPFIGMPSMKVPRFLRLSYDVDDVLFDALLRIWKKRFLTPGKNDKHSRRLFRSIEMAYHALSVPSKNESTHYDYGVNISLWVSAFEILAHQNKSNVDLNTVLGLLETYPWTDRKLKAKRYKIIYRRNKKNVNLIQKMYKYLYDTRNGFLHGNEIDKNVLFPGGNKKMQPLFVIAPTIYRIALFSYLNKNKMVKQPKSLHEFEYYIIQRRYEDFLLNIIGKEE
ncbi:MAG: hypothetical protein VR72_21145 [Clostridiaceae bacterium BRH_c20a]|nr:MAG: hypothetical protein VR72_21145 [Clostridiaceae bacterium BRH_c20a]